MGRYSVSVPNYEPAILGNYKRVLFPFFVLNREGLPIERYFDLASQLLSFINLVFRPLKEERVFTKRLTAFNKPLFSFRL